MSYPIGTILTRIDPLPDIVDERTIDDGEGNSVMGKVTVPNPLNVVRVGGPSPIKTPSLTAWQGTPGDTVIITPHAEFGPNAIAPVQALHDEYEVTEYPEETDERQKIVLSPKQRLQQGESPEQQFARASREAEKAETKRGPGRPRKNPDE